MFSRFLCHGLICGLLLAGCATAPSVPQAASEIAPTVAPAPQRAIVHARGTTLVPREPQRVVVLTNEATDIVLALGLTPAGAVQSWGADPYYDYIAVDMAGVPTVGDELQPNLEAIVALQPDLIIGSQVRQGAVYEQLSVIAPTIFSETLGETWQENLRLYGQALNREAAATQLLAEWENRVATQRQRFAQQGTQVSLVRFLPDTARVYLQDSFPGQIIAAVGLQRPPSQTAIGFAQEVSFEEIPQMDADVLFYFTYADAEEASHRTAQPWLSHPLWQQLAVVQAGRAYAVSDVVWTTGGGIQAAHLLLDDLERYLAQ